jgi:hypothetical protein
MQDLVRASILLLALGGTIPALAVTPATKVDDKALEWCLSHFPVEESLSPADDIKPLPRPAGKFHTFDLAGARTPPGLVRHTEIIGPLPPEIEKYEGQWIWPTHEDSPRFAIFVERLTATEMTIGWAIKPENDRDEGGYRKLRNLLRWTGKSFSHSESSADGSETLDIVISADGEAMLIVSGYSRLVTIEDGTGKQSTHTFGEAWPLCFISSKHY